MKPLLICLSLIAVLSIADDEFQNSGVLPCPAGDKARFQIIAAPINDGDNDANAAIVRLDTFTGQCWRSQIMPVYPGQKASVQVWVPIYEYDSPMIKAALGRMKEASK